MPDNPPVTLTISRVIPAPKWRIIRLLTRVQDFPSYIPSVRKITVLQKVRRAMRTEWHIEVDKIPVYWIEEDKIDLKDGSMSFEAVEGDLEVFGGRWSFKEHPEGTEVEVEVRLRVNIPAIKEFAEARLKSIVRRNFEAILEAVERRLISLRYAAYKKGNIDKIAGFGLVGHFYNYRHFESYLRGVHPEVKMPSSALISQLFHLTPSFKACDLRFISKTGQETKGCFILATFFPDMIERDAWSVYSKIVKACKIAEKQGIGIVSIAGFCSIPGYRIGHEVSSELNIPVTTGKAFTASLIIDGIMRAIQLLEIDLARANLAVVGGAGDLGSACCRLFAGKVRKLTITGTSKDSLKRVSGELRTHHSTQLICVQNNQEALRDADIVIAAASMPASILDSAWFKPGAVVCDAGYPKNVSYLSVPRDDILIFDGGLAQSPYPLQIPIDLRLPSENVIFGSFAEAIILALESRYENFSGTRGSITPQKVEEIRLLGRKHGFELTDFYRANKVISPKTIETARAAARKNVGKM